MGFKSILKTMFPFISVAASLGGPLGTMAAKTVGTALGINIPDTSEDGITKAITDAQIKDPNALIKIQQAEHDFQLQMEKLGLDSIEKLEKIASDDRVNARAREIAVKDKIPAIMAITVTAGFFGLLALMVFRNIPMDSQVIINVMVGSLGTAWVGIVNYYFGSSSGSVQKTAIMADQAKNNK